MWMEIQDIMLNKISQIQEDKHCIFSLTHGNWREKKRSESRRETINDQEWVTGG